MLFDSLQYWPRTYLVVGGAAFALSASLMPLLIFLLRRLGVLDPVAANKIHHRPVPRGGGLVIFLAFALAVLLPDYRSHGMNGILIGGFICLCVGAADDFIGGVAGLWKLLTLTLVTLILWWYGVGLNIFQNDLLDITLTLLWIVGVTSAFNGIDNMDGLAGGTAVIVSLMFFIIAFQAYATTGTETSLSWFGLLAVGLIGANLGFLLYNFHPARIFMGDSGSFFLGFTLAALGVMGEWNDNRLIAAAIPMLILGVPLFDFAYIILARILKGETRTLRQVIDHCAPDHLSHRLTWIGFSQRKAVLFIYLFSLALGVAGILLRNSNSYFDTQLALFQGFAIVTIVIILMTTAERRHRHYIDEAVAELEKDRRHIAGAPQLAPEPGLARDAADSAAAPGARPQPRPHPAPANEWSREH